MKGNNGTGNTLARDGWRTPDWLFELLHQQYNFTYDCCASEENAKIKPYSSDFLSVSMVQNGWMNPPFSNAKEMFIHFFAVVYRGVAIYRCDNLETYLWQEIILGKCDWVFVPSYRIKYEGQEGNGVRFPSALIGFGFEPPIGLIERLLKNETKSSD